MFNINLNLYKIFYVVAKSNSFIDASRKLYISQPAVSKDIKILEEQLKTNLFYRKNNGISLTEDGKELLKYIEESFGYIDTGEKIILQRNDLSNGIINIGCPSHITSFYLIDYIEQFRKKYQHIKVNVLSASTKQLIEDLELNKIDFIIDGSPINSIYNNLEIIEIKEFKTTFISNKPIKITEISRINEYDYILPFEYSNTRENLDKALQKHGIRLNPIMNIDITDVIIKLVKRKMGIGYVIKDTVKKDIEEKKFLKFCCQ